MSYLNNGDTVHKLNYRYVIFNIRLNAESDSFQNRIQYSVDIFLHILLSETRIQQVTIMIFWKSLTPDM